MSKVRTDPFSLSSHNACIYTHDTLVVRLGVEARTVADPLEPPIQLEVEPIPEIEKPEGVNVAVNTFGHPFISILSENTEPAIGFVTVITESVGLLIGFTE